MKKTMCTLLAVVLILLLVPTSSLAEDTRHFTDIQNETTLTQAEALYALGVVQGVGDRRFLPDSQLTRAQFCKMMVVILGREAEEPAARERTIFSDVLPTHWARGYICIAGTGENPIVNGMGNGCFEPDSPLTFAQAVTILLRVLGYTDQDAGMNWPKGYLALGARTELTKGLSLQADSRIVRAQALQLMTQLLLTQTKDHRYLAENFGKVVRTTLLSVEESQTKEALQITTADGKFSGEALPYGCQAGDIGVLIYDETKTLISFVKDSTHYASVSGILLSDTEENDGFACIEFLENGIVHTYPYSFETAGKIGKQGVLLLTDAKTAFEFYPIQESAYRVEEDVLILQKQDKKVTTPDGSFSCLSSFEAEAGTKGRLVIDSANRAVWFLPEENHRNIITVSEAEATYVKDTEGNRYRMAENVSAYEGTEPLSWSVLWQDIRAGMTMVLFTNDADRVETVYLYPEEDLKVFICPNNEMLPAELVGKDGLSLYKNGVKVAKEEICRFDVAEYNPDTKTVVLSSAKLTGVYENAFPNAKTPSQIQMLGTVFSLLPRAQDRAASFSTGDKMTLLFTQGGNVAGIVPVSDWKEEAPAIVTERNGEAITVALLHVYDKKHNRNLELKSKTWLTKDNTGDLVTVSSTQKDYLSVKEPEKNEVSGKLNTEQMAMGKTPVSAAVTLLDRVHKSEPILITMADVPKEVAKEDILYAHRNVAGKIDIIIFNDLTGDCYTYGFFKRASREDGKNKVAVLSVVTKDRETEPVDSAYRPANGTPGGIAENARAVAMHKTVVLTCKTVSRQDFFRENGKVFVRVNGVVYPVWEKVQCYNKKVDVWFETLDDARAYAPQLTVCFDRAPEQNGKIRIVIAE